MVTDPAQEGVRVRRFDRDIMLDLGPRGGAWSSGGWLREGEGVRDEYPRRLPELTSRDTWTRLFDTK